MGCIVSYGSLAPICKFIGTERILMVAIASDCAATLTEAWVCVARFPVCVSGRLLVLKESVELF